MTIAWLAAMAVALACAPAAVAAPGKLTLLGCQSSAAEAALNGCATLEGAGGLNAMAVSADGLSAYATRRGRLTGFARDPNSGALTFRDCVSSTVASPCDHVPLLGGDLSELVVTRDGRDLYVAGSGHTLNGFRLDAGGALTHSWCEYSAYGAEGDLPDCAVGDFDETLQLAASEDGLSVFMADRICTDNTGDCAFGVIAYLRNVETGRLLAAGRTRWTMNGGGPFAIDRGGQTLYQLDRRSDRISVHNSVKPTWGMRPIQCLSPDRTRPCDRIRAIAKASELAVAPGGRHVLAVIRAGGEPSFVLMRRGAGGRLRLGRVIRPLRRSPIDAIGSLRFSEDGRSLYALARANKTMLLVRFRVRRKSGTVAFAECISPARLRKCSVEPRLDGLRSFFLGGGLVYASTGSDESGSGTLMRFRP